MDISLYTERKRERGGKASTLVKQKGDHNRLMCISCRSIKKNKLENRTEELELCQTRKADGLMTHKRCQRCRISMSNRQSGSLATRLTGSLTV